MAAMDADNEALHGAAMEATRALEATCFQQVEALADRARGLAKRRAELSEKTGAAAEAPPALLSLNVGGDTNSFEEVRRARLLLLPSRLKQMFSGRWDNKLPRDQGGRFFLDWDPKHMRAILDWLLDLELARPDLQPPEEALPTDQRWGFAELMKYLQLDGAAAPQAVRSAANTAAGAATGGGAHELQKVTTAAEAMEMKLSQWRAKLDGDEASLARDQAGLEDETAFMQQYLSRFAQTGAIVYLNVDGVRMAAARATLLQEADSLLATRVGPQEGQSLEDAVRFDENPEIFGHVINHLRLKQLGVATPSMPHPHLSGTPRTRLNRLAHALGISDCVETKFGSVLANCEQQENIQAWLPKGRTGGPLLFRASLHGFEEACFHTHCDGKGSTLIIARSTEGFVVGGFADVPWDSSNSWKGCGATGSFIFRVAGPNGLVAAKCRYTSATGHGIYCGTNNGVAFGGGHDLFINLAQRKILCRNPGHSYEAVGGQCLIHDCDLADYEVFLIR